MSSPVVTILVGPSGSGKSTLARNMVTDDKKKRTVRLNRDDIRSMLTIQDGPRVVESNVIHAQKTLMAGFVGDGFNVVIDDTNLNPKTVEGWIDLSQRLKATPVIHHMDASLATCISNDFGRQGRAKVGRPVIERQFLMAGRLQFGKLPIAIVDIDGTLAQNKVHRSPYDESKVLLDPVYGNIRDWVNMLHSGMFCEGNPTGVSHTVILVSGRHSTCGPDTVEWLEKNRVNYDHIFMRHAWDQRQDTIVKREILGEILNCGVTKEQIALVIDDRPSVLNMWFDEGLKIYPAREVKEPF